MKKLKILLVSTAILASAYLGDHYNVKDRFIEPIKYRNARMDPNSYQKPFQLKKRYQINKEGKLETYIGHDDKWYKVDKDLRVNERSLSEILKDETKEIVPYVKKKVDELFEWYKRNFENENNK